MAPDISRAILTKRGYRIGGASESRGGLFLHSADKTNEMCTDADPSRDHLRRSR